MVAGMNNMIDPTAHQPKSLLRELFNTEVAPKIATELGLPGRLSGHGYSRRFAFFADEKHLAVVAGAQENDDVELALAYAVRHANGRRLTLVLPEGHTNATAQRAPWLREAARPKIFTHRAGGDINELPPRSQADTVLALAEPPKGLSPAEELANATSPSHLGNSTDGVWALVEWATTYSLLDPGHRSGERSWHYAGLRVLSIRRTKGGVSITAGIHYGGANKPPAVTLVDGQQLSTEALTALQATVNDAIEQRKGTGPKAIHRPDEHWLQAMLRRHPQIVGVEQPALRELPAWRPHDSTGKWGRGYLDLLGLDGHGAIRVIETKLATNSDDLLVLQGLDYYVWATAYLDVLRSRLGATKSAELEIHYVLGANPSDDSIKLSPCTGALASALDDSVRWRFQVVHDWFQHPEQTSTPTATIFSPATVPTSLSTHRPFVIERVPVPAWIDNVAEIDAMARFGEDTPWGFAIPWMYQAAADPCGGLPMLQAPRRGEDFWPGALAYWSSLLHLLVYGFGWSRPDRGLKWWFDAGKPTDDLKLELLSDVWDADGQLEWFAAWLWTNDNCNFLSRERVGTRVVVDPEWLERVERNIRGSGAPAPYGGGYDPLHLCGHIDGPIRPSQSQGRSLVLGADDATVVLTLDAMCGWYSELLEAGQHFAATGQAVSAVEVRVRPVGALGKFHLSPTTGLWFSGGHDLHLLGN